MKPICVAFSTRISNTKNEPVRTFPSKKTRRYFEGYSPRTTQRCRGLVNFAADSNWDYNMYEGMNGL